jgi:GT2 family glycosyltransferase
MTRPVVVPMMPFALDRNLGAAYNEAMDRVPPDGWACFLDHDMMFTTRVWFPQIVEAILAAPAAGAFTAVTNRIAAPWQQAREADTNCHDIAVHRRIGQARLKQRTLLDITDTKGFGGVVMVLSKAAWREAGGFVDGLLCVDHQMHFALGRAGRRVYLIESLYCYHWRRAHGDELPADTPRAAGCPCRGAEQAPTVRLPIPEVLL